MACARHALVDRFNLVLRDGSVRSISYSIDPDTHANLSNRQDGQVIDASKF